MELIPIVHRLPLERLYRGVTEVAAQRRGWIGIEEIKTHLRTSLTPFVIVEVGAPPRWIESDDRFQVWKSELRDRMVPPDAEKWFREDFPDERYYLASEWFIDGAVGAIVFEKGD